MIRKTSVVLLAIMMAAGALIGMPGAEATASQWVDEGTTPVDRTAFAGAELPDGTMIVATGIDKMTNASVLEEANGSLASSEAEVSGLEEQMDAKLDAWVGYVLLGMLGVVIVMLVVQMVRKR